MSIKGFPLVPFDLEQSLEYNGFTCDHSCAPILLFSREDILIRVIYSDNCIQFAAQKSFDKWENSVIYEAEIPYDFYSMARVYCNALGLISLRR